MITPHEIAKQCVALARHGAQPGQVLAFMQAISHEPKYAEGLRLAEAALHRESESANRVREIVRQHRARMLSASDVSGLIA